MAKFAAVLSLLLVLAVYATAHKTITTTVVVEEESRPTQRCKEEVQKMNFNPCLQFLRESGSRTRSLIVGQGGQMSEKLRPCCQQLQKVDKECQCDAVGAVFAKSETQMGERTAVTPEMKVLESLMVAECGMLHCERGQSF